MPPPASAVARPPAVTPNPVLAVIASSATAAETTAVDTEPEGARLRADRRALRVLLVEDHDDSAAVYSRLLRNAGHAVTRAASIAEARAAAGPARARAFDLIISDLGLPDGSGLDLLYALDVPRGFPAIALSGYGMDQDREQSTAAGYARHLLKPVSPPALMQAIADLFPETRG